MNVKHFRKKYYWGEKNWRFQNFDFLVLKNVSPGQFWGAPTHEDIIEF